MIKSGLRMAMTANRLTDLSMASVWAGLTAFVWYGFGALPLHLEVASRLELSPAQSSSWIFIIWFAGAVASIALSWHYRQPIPITWTIPGLIYLGTLSGQFSFAEIVGANIVAGVAILMLGVTGIGRKVMTWLPLPIVMGMFAGSILVYVTRMVAASVQDFLVAGITVISFLLGRLIGDSRCPPMGLAVVAGGVAVVVFGNTDMAAVSYALPQLVIPDVAFSVPAIIAITTPMVILAVGLGNVQGLGFLIAQGYRVPVTPVTIAVGVNSLVNTLLGGHAATVARTGAAIVAGPEAGPLATRYWASIIAAALTVLIALGAGTLSSLLSALPRSFVVTLAGLAILASLQSAFEVAFKDRLKFGALGALAVAATPFSVFGITSAFWALIAGIVVSLLAERRELLTWWRSSE